MLRPSRAPQRGQANPSGWSRSKSFWRQLSWSIRATIGKSMGSAPRRSGAAGRRARRTDPEIAEKGRPPDWLHEPELLLDRERPGVVERRVASRRPFPPVKRNVLGVGQGVRKVGHRGGLGEKSVGNDQGKHG